MPLDKVVAADTVDGGGRDAKTGPANPSLPLPPVSSASLVLSSPS